MCLQIYIIMIFKYLFCIFETNIKLNFLLNFASHSLQGANSSNQKNRNYSLWLYNTFSRHKRILRRWIAFSSHARPRNLPGIIKILGKADALLLNSLYLYCYIYLNSVGISNTYLDPHVCKPLCYTRRSTRTSQL